MARFKLLLSGGGALQLSGGIGVLLLSGGREVVAPTIFTVNGIFFKPDGVTRATGNVTFTPARRIVLDNQAVSGGSVTASIVNGVLEQSLAAYAGGYEVCENVDGRMPSVYDIPGDLVGPINLDEYGPQ